MQLSVILKSGTGSARPSPDDVIAGSEGWTTNFVICALCDREGSCQLKSMVKLPTQHKRGVPSSQLKTGCPEIKDGKLKCALNSIWLSPWWGHQSSRGAPTYNFAKFRQKLHEIERIWTPGGYASLAPP